MLIENAGIPLLVNRVHNHSKIKPNILKLIDEMPNFTGPKTSSVYDKISKTDWPALNEFPRNYWPIVEPIVKEIVCNSMFEHFKYEQIEIVNYWFQQYMKSDAHGFHVHPSCHWANVYFVELPDNTIKTQILNFKREKMIDYDIQEGDILTFPSMLYHRSPLNLQSNRKTIISFNIDVIR